jgi:putative membrane protein
MANPNRTRDHLANERTFLAWVRTAMGLIGLGFVVARMGLFLRQIAAEFPGPSRTHGHGAGSEFLVTGVVFLAIGTALAGMSAWLHDRNRRAIEAENYEPTRLGVIVLAAVVVAGGLILAVLVIWRTSVGPGPAG